MQKDRHVAVWLRMLAEKEIGLARNARSLLKSQGRRAADALKKEGAHAAEHVIKLGLNDWVKVLTAHYSITVKDFVHYTNEQLIGTKSTKRTFQNIVQEFISKEALSRSKTITDTSVEKARSVILRGQENGDGEETIASDLQDEIGGDIADSRARTIARTEIHNAATYGMQAAAEEVQRDSGLDITREWVAVMDERTREEHADADGQERGLDEPFEVGDEELDRPGEGSPENSINCRCTLIYHTPDGSDYEGDDGE